MDFDTFEIGFWHPFGPHVHETCEQIIERKRKEIAANGWTLWSFQYRRPAVLEAWHAELSAVVGPRYVFCSNSASAVDPAEAGELVPDCPTYKMVGDDAWRPIPAGVRVPHPFRGPRRVASAFVVAHVYYPAERLTRPTVEWWSEGQWRQTRAGPAGGGVPTRGEYLIRRGGVAPLRPVRAVLELRSPFLALVCADATPDGGLVAHPRVMATLGGKRRVKRASQPPLPFR